MTTKAQNFHHTISAIEDLRSLVASDFKPIADNALYHVQEMKHAYEFDWSMSGEAYSSIRSVLEGQIKSLFDFYASTNKQITKTHFVYEKETFGLKPWNKLLDSLDLVLRSMSFFRFHGPLVVNLRDNRLVVTSNLRKFKCEGELRVRLYALIREFLKKECLFTYEIMEHQNESSLSLVFDFSHKSDEYLCFNTEFGSFSFSSILRGYEVKNLGKLQGVKHQVLVVDENYQLSIETQVPESYFQTFASNEAKFTVFHFSFLFRPVSLIIPMRGEIQFFREKTGAHVDIFSIINK